MRFYNTLGRQIQDFKPLKRGEVKLYTCGPTVYDYAHVGNLRSFVFDDSLRRALEVNGFKVKHVMNITDVGHLISDMDEGEDKLETGAVREGKTVWQVAEHYTKAFIADAESLNILTPNGYKGSMDNYARATAFIEEQIYIVERLLDKGFAYQTDQAIYFDVTKLPTYGQLAGQELTDKEVGVREQVVTDAEKRHPQDFALWFFLTGRFANHTMRWDSPWGPGFPGWHIECSAIIHKTLGDPIDIHTGGVDHIGTHHPNEMAQTEAAYGHQLANFWLHNEFVLVDGQKMAKSQANFITLKDIIARGINPLALRLLFLQAHYRSQLNFTWQSLDAAQTRLKKYQSFADLRFQPKSDNQLLDEGFFDQAQTRLKDDLANDLSTGAFLAHLDEVLDRIDQHGHAINAAQIKAFRHFIEFIDDALGLSLTSSKDISEAQKQLIAERQAARDAKDWSRSDSIRHQLQAQGLEVNDTPSGSIWSRR